MKFHYAWVSGHTETSGNEKGNLLAKKATTISCVGPPPHCGIGMCTCIYKGTQGQKGVAQSNPLVECS